MKLSCRLIGDAYNVAYIGAFVAIQQLRGVGAIKLFLADVLCSYRYFCLF